MQQASGFQATAAAQARICGEVAQALEQATSGTRQLDLLVACALGEADIGSDTVFHELLAAGAIPAHAGLLGISSCAPFTTSLDAALPGEAIVLSVYAPGRRQWSAVHRDRNGEETVAHAANETLARRAAALKALARALTAGDIANEDDYDDFGEVSVDQVLADAVPSTPAVPPRRRSLEQAARLEQGQDPAELRRILRSISAGERQPPLTRNAGHTGAETAANDIEGDARPDDDWEIRF